MNKKAFWLGYVAGIVLSIAFMGFLYLKYTQQKNKAIELKKIEVFDTKEERVDLTNYIKEGKPLVVNFWATWCAPCIEEFPHFDELSKELKDEVNFVMITDDSIQKLENFRIKNSYHFTHLRSEKKLDQYGISVRPTTYFFNAKGELVHNKIGGIDKEVLKELVNSIQK